MNPELLNADQRRLLLQIARESIVHGLDHAGPDCNWSQHNEPVLNEWTCSFVTIYVSKQLHGCIGTVEPHRPLGEDICQNAFAAAFRDPRFPALTGKELGDLSLKVSLLSEPIPLEVRDEADLFAKLRPGIDGLIMEEHVHRALFLPSVWDQLPEVSNFVSQLKLKAGLSKTHWSPDLKLQTFHTVEFGDAEPS